MSEETNCRHEYVIIYQRRLKGLDRRLLSTRAYLPVGFNMNDFKHLSEGSFCFCSKCRKRLFPKKSKAEKLAARLERKRLKEEELAKIKAEAEAVRGAETETESESEEENSELSGLADSTSGLPFGLSKVKQPVEEEDDDDDDDDDDDETLDDNEMNSDEVDEDSPELEVDELEVESIDVEDIKAEGVKISSDDDLDASCDMDEEDDS